MVREILIPTEPTLYVQLPPEMVGKRVEVRVEELPDPDEAETALAETPLQRLAAVRQIFAGISVDLSNFKFDRDEANNYDDE